MTRPLLPTLFAAALLATPALAVDAERGRYLVAIIGCNDCHTPGHFLGKPDMERFLGGSDVGFEIPGLGVFHGPNLTPDEETGLGSWSEAEIATAIRTGVRPDGRHLSPAMPWMGYAALTEDDALSIAAWLKTLAPISNAVPGPFGPGEASGGFVMKVVAP
ncbi:c-type cytochrome [Tabrizicola soli]|uniref:C-type cytochrome n=1 Tax=Tabrizicola soli TaxID=2185115 RepID=A0ABV7DTY8_9RHOB|nr:c-type cytochrome [Tabrizicola soli]